ncbi:hypothetical protein [Microvirga massiliensis]|uniref:hypothetical protein n=1 Tax=Microvirga massiliensis TaxID=1033741 RepID=UPI00062B69D5|nr:hypothetical protein [Microvirga massiliensis]
MSDILDHSFNRVLWRDGDRLTAADLQAEVERDQVLRSLHVARLHGTWGIALGLDVRAVEAGLGGAKQVAVGAGYAIDQQGRDLILPTGMVLDIPVTPQSTIFVLCAAAVTTEALSTATDAPMMEGLDPRIERAAFVWRTAHDAPFANEVPLTALRATNGASTGALDPSVRRLAQRAARPYIATSMTDLGATDWQLSRDAPSASIQEMIARVDTTDAGFSMLPVYAARIMMLKVQPSTSGMLAGAPPDPTLVVTPEDLMALEYGYIVQTDRTFFEYRVPITDISTLEFARKGWAIGWEGIEPLPDCGPKWSALHFFTLAGLRLSMLRFSTPASGVHL